jgi:hypothetical protein
MSENEKQILNTPAKELSAEQKEIIALELEAKRLEVRLKKAQLEGMALEAEEREFNVKDLRSRIAERDLRERQLAEDRKSQGRTFQQDEAQDKLRWSLCTHKKGGVVTPRDLRVLHTGGNKEQYAVIKHQMINGDIWVLCLRCAKTWKPPVEKDYFYDAQGKNVAPIDGTFSQERFERAKFEYLQAINFNTNNTMSTSVQCRFTELKDGKNYDAADQYRELVSQSNLR